jgi:glutamate-1-semialdehyde 2,1-aminomutase
LRLLESAAYERLERTTARLANGLVEAAAEANVPVHVAVTCGLLTVFFSDREITDYEDAKSADAGRYARFFNSMLAAGIYLPPSPFEAWFPSLAHGAKEIERTLDAAAEAFARVSDE